MSSSFNERSSNRLDMIVWNIARFFKGGNMNYKSHHFIGGLKVPTMLPRNSVLKAAPGFQPPSELILTGYCVPVDDQGTKPWCAAYSAANYAENILWRLRGRHEEIDPAPLYAYAKQIDGDPNGEGTYLECTLKALLEKGYFDKARCEIKTIGGSVFGNASALLDVKFAIHRYGVVMAGFNITDEWYSPKKGVVRGDSKNSIGGHAVLVVGYDEDGVVIQNSWGSGYAHDGFVYLTNKAFEKQFMYAAFLTNTLDGMK